MPTDPSPAHADAAPKGGHPLVLARARAVLGERKRRLVASLGELVGALDRLSAVARTAEPALPARALLDLVDYRDVVASLAVDDPHYATAIEALSEVTGEIAACLRARLGPGRPWSAANDA